MNYTTTDNYVSVSEFSQGKANRIFNEVARDNKEVIVMKNNKPTAVILSASQYNSLIKRLDMLEHYVEAHEQSGNQCIIGIAEGMFKCPDDIQFSTNTAHQLFGGR